MDNLPELTPISLDMSQIQCKCFYWKIPETRHTIGLIIFSGFYRRGSLGKPDTQFIRWRIQEFCEIERPTQINGLVVDFRELDYLVGDDLDVHHEIFGKPIRVVIPTAETDYPHHKAFLWPLDEEFVCTDMADAFQQIHEILKAK